MINLFWSGLLTVLLISGCGWDGSATRPNDFTPLTSITISAVSSTIASGTSTMLTATGHYSGQFDRDITDQAIWSSASPAVADFTFNTSPNKNRVSGVTPGTAVVTATVGNISATYSLTVSSATIQTMTVTPSASSIPNGLTAQFAASGTFSDATTQDLTFDAVWSSSPGTFATISNSPASKGLATALTVGVETISATFGGIAIPPTATLTVTAAILQSITVTPANSSIEGFSKTKVFTATGNYSDGTTPDITAQATWSSSLTTVATITTGGAATTVAAGTTSISATLNGISGSTDFTVTAPVLNSNGLQITPANPTVVAGATQQLTLTATFSDGSSQNVSASSTWASSSPATASVITNTGLVTGNLIGSATITAQYGGQLTTTIVTVIVR